MEKKTLIIAMTIATVVISTLLQVWMQGRDVSPQARKLLWLTVAAGALALVAVAMVLLTR